VLKTVKYKHGTIKRLKVRNKEITFIFNNHLGYFWIIEIS